MPDTNQNHLSPDGAQVSAPEENRRRIIESEIPYERAQAATEAKGRFLASMNHAIRTPVQTAVGLLDLMRTDNLDETQASCLRDVRQMTEALLDVMDDALDLHRIETGRLELLPVHFQLSDLLGDLVSRYQPMAEAAGLAFAYSFAPDLPTTLYGDAMRIGQILSNLLSNAIKYTQQGSVRLDATCAGDPREESIIFAVTDSGVGIRAEYLARFQADKENLDPYDDSMLPGAGPGLVIAIRLAEMMRGSVKPESEFGKGSVFTFSLPLVKGDYTLVAPEGETERVLAASDTKVLLVDDNAGNAAVAAGLLARHGIAAATAADGREAVDMVRANRYDLVFMDHIMPVMDGVEATKAIRALGDAYAAELPIVALSANVADDAGALFLSSGMNDFLPKPVSEKELNRVLLRWLPGDKIMGQGSAGEPAAAPDGETVPHKLLEELIRIKDMRVVDGLSQVGGDTRLYRDILWQFCNGAKKDAAELQESQEGGKWEAYAVKIHAIRSDMVNIGHLFLSDWALSLERAVSRGDLGKCINETHYFCHNLLLFHNTLRKTELMESLAIREQKEKITFDALKSKLALLLPACEDFLAEDAEAIADELLLVSYDTAIDPSLVELRNLVHSFDYDEAIILIGRLLESLTR